MATRVERVVLELDDNLTSGMAKAAAATALLKRELGGVDGESTRATRSTKAFGDQTQRTGTQAGRANAELNSYAGRIRLIAEVAAGLGPALVPIGAVAVPAAFGLADALGGVAIGAGTALLAFHGLGTGVAAINKAALDPTVTNLQAAQLALEHLPPAARAFAAELAHMRPALDAARQAAASGLFPGLEDSLHRLQTVFPQIDKLLFHTGEALGNLAREGAASLAGPEWAHFLSFIAREAPVALTAFGHAVGDVIHGLGQLWMAFTPLNHGFLRFIEDAARGFDNWATGLSKTQGFHEFIAYLSNEGPKVADAVAAIGNAVLQIVEAAAPLGGPILQALTAVANAIAAIADSQAGPAILATVTALSLLSRAQAGFGKIAESSAGRAVTAIRRVVTEEERATLTAKQLARTEKGIADARTAGYKTLRSTALKGGLAAAGLGIAASGIADNFGLANTATLALTGSLAGPWGAAMGGAVGLLLDASKSSNEFQISTDDVTQSLNQQTGAITQNTRAYVAQQLQKQGVFDDAQRLGLSLDLVTKAALGNKDALDQISPRLNDLANQQGKVVSTGKGAAVVTTDQTKAARALLAALGATSGAIENGRGKIRQLSIALGGSTSSFRTARTAAEQFRLEINRVNDVLTKRKSLRDYQQALDDFTKSLKKNGQTLDVNTQAGRDNQAALDAIASSAIAYAQTLKGADQVAFLQKSKRQFVEAAINAGLTTKAAQRLADNLYKLSRIVAKPKIYVDGIPESLARLEQLAAALRNLDKSATITAHVTGGRVLMGNAEGGTIPGQRAPYGDKVLSWVAPGEEVISNRHGQADRHRDLLKSINARRYEDGGTVAASRVSVNVSPSFSSGGGSSIDYGRLADAVSAVQPAPPLYGDVHISGDPTAFKRQMNQDRAMAALSGVRRG